MGVLVSEIISMPPTATVHGTPHANPAARSHFNKGQPSALLDLPDIYILHSTQFANYARSA